MRKEFKAKGSKRVSKAISMVFSVFFVFAIGLSIVLHEILDFKGIILGVVALLIFGYHACKWYLKEYEEEDKISFSNKYKDFYLKKYINSLGFEYAKRGKIERNNIILSALFEEFQTSSGNDLIIGKIDGVDFEFCDLELKVLDWVDENTGKECESSVFQGLFFVADFNKKMQDRIIVTPNSATSKNGYKKIKMDNSEFNDEFSVFSADIQQAMYVQLLR